MTKRTKKTKKTTIEAMALCSEAVACMGNVGAILIRALVPGYSDRDYRVVVVTLAISLYGEQPATYLDATQRARTAEILKTLLTKLGLDPGTAS